MNCTTCRFYKYPWKENDIRCGVNPSWTDYTVACNEWEQADDAIFLTNDDMILTRLEKDGCHVSEVDLEALCKKHGYVVQEIASTLGYEEATYLYNA